MESKDRKNEVTVLFVCSLCGQVFSKKYSLDRHMKNIHKTSAIKCAGRGNLRCPLCNSNNLSSYQELQTHCQVNHNQELEHDSFQFNSFNDFLKWKQIFEKDTQSCYILARTVKKNGNKHRYYVCHRSGTYRPNLKENQRKRRLKQQGSNKINGTCPAHVVASQLKNGNEIKVRVVRTHLGHECEVRRMPLAKPDRDIIAGKLLQGIHRQKILEDIGSKFDSKLRICFTTRRDINNIKNSYNIQSDVIFDDAQSVNIFIKQFEKSEDNPILHYKPYGIEDSEGVIEQNNFFLVFMNKAQQEILNQYGNNILMIDSTHETNSYKIQLSSLLILDDAYQGFPVAFLWSITQTETVYQKFFSCLKKKVPHIKPAFFMSDDCDLFYNSFVKIYEHFPKKLLCVKRSLSDNLSKIPQVEKRKEVKKKLYALVNELDEITFVKLLQSFLDILNSDCDTKNYAEYFMSYVNRSEQWAHCFRKDLHQNTNKVLERWHQEVAKRKCQQLDVSINNIIECLRMKFMKHLVMCRSKVTELSSLKRRHKIAEELLNQKGNTEVIEEIPNSQWLVPLYENNTKDNTLLEYYQVKALNENDRCNCSFLCDDCSVCLHGMSCTCHDYLIQFNMCKHIHIIGQMFLKNNVGHSDDNSEQSAISTQKSRRDKLEDEIKLTVDKINELLQVVKNSTNLDTVLYVSKNINSVLAGTRALESQTKSLVIAEPRQDSM